MKHSQKPMYWTWTPNHIILRHSYEGSSSWYPILLYKRWRIATVEDCGERLRNWVTATQNKSLMNNLKWRHVINENDNTFSFWLLPLDWTDTVTAYTAYISGVLLCSIPFRLSCIQALTFEYTTSKSLVKRDSCFVAYQTLCLRQLNLLHAAFNFIWWEICAKNLMRKALCLSRANFFCIECSIESAIAHAVWMHMHSGARKERTAYESSRLSAIDPYGVSIVFGLYEKRNMIFDSCFVCVYSYFILSDLYGLRFCVFKDSCCVFMNSLFIMLF